MKKLTGTNSAGIAAAMMGEREDHGSPAMGMVMTMIIVADEDVARQAINDARLASHEHPSRVLGVITGDGRGRPNIDAEIGIGDGWTGETALITLTGEVVKHADSVITPLLLPDSPVVVWWPTDHPADPASDPVGALGTRRITDAASATHHRTKALEQLYASYVPGTTDLAWTRLTPWRALLAAALDQQPLPVRSASVAAEKISPSADLLAEWLHWRLKVDVERTTSDGPGITEVSLETSEGPITISRGDGRLANFSSPGRPDRPMALARRGIPELLAEELRRLDEDDIYGQVVQRIARDGGVS